MPTHIFSLNEENWNIVKKSGVVGIPGFPEGKRDVNDQLLSRLLIVKPGDHILFYVSRLKALYGLYMALEYGFHDTTQVWNSDNDQIYPFRLRFDITKYSFSVPMTLDEIFDLKDSGIIWTFSLSRPNNVANALFSITNSEEEEIFKRLMKKNATARRIKKIPEPYPNKDPNLIKYLTIENEMPKYEATIMALLADAFTKNRYQEFFGEYTDYIAYVPTSFQKEIDFLLLTQNPNNINEILSYNILEVKRGIFDESSLSQLIKYEDWFLRKKVSGDYSMVRTTAIANGYSQEVIDYISKRKRIENKEILLLNYKYDNSQLELTETIL